MNLMNFPQNHPFQNNRDDLNNIVDDEELRRFKAIIEESPVDEWKTRTSAFELLVTSIPEVKQKFQTAVPKWYQSAQALARLSTPLSSLILDARSTVVKHTCHHIQLLVQRCNIQNPPFSDVCRYLLRDLLPSVINLSAQTVNVIRNYAVDMMCKLIPICRFKSGLPTLLDRLRFDKSRDVREACIRYLKLVLQHWCGTNASTMDNDINLQPYLSTENCTHIGKALAYALSDPSQTVRMEARQSFEIFRDWYPDIWSDIIHDPDGVFGKDMKLKKTILDSASRIDAEKSIGHSVFGDDNSTVGSFESRNGESMRSSSVMMRQEGVASRTGPPSRPNPGIRGPPLRVMDNPYLKLPPKIDFHPKNDFSRVSSTQRLLSIPTEEAMISHAPNPLHQRAFIQKLHLSKNETRAKAARTIQAAFRTYLARTFINSPYPNMEGRSSNAKSPFMRSVSNGSYPQKKIFSGDDSFGSTLSPFQSTSLDDHGISLASSEREIDVKLKSRNSSMLLIKRLQKGGTPSSPSLNHDSSITDQNVIAGQLLTAHKAYIDELMEILQSEMSLIKNFEEKNKSTRSSHGNYPSEEDVITYFESVYQLLDKETHNANTLRSALVRISQGEPM
jgi:hypothetical protein